MIRRYEPRDLEEVLDTWAAASAVGHPFLDDAFLAQERHDIQHVYIPNAETWVYEMDGRVVGYLALVGNEVGIREERRRAGILCELRL